MRCVPHTGERRHATSGGKWQHPLQWQPPLPRILQKQAWGLSPAFRPAALVLGVDGSGFDHGFYAAVRAANVVRDAKVTDGKSHRDRHRITHLEDGFLAHRWH